MRFNALGDAAYGYATVSINGATPAALASYSAGCPFGPAWLTSTTIFYQNDGIGGGGPYISESYNTGTTTRTTVSPLGLNQCAAGNSKWATWLANAGVTTNIGSLGTIAGAKLGDVSPDGELAIITDYQSGVGLKVYSAAGALLLNDASVLIVGIVTRLRNHLLSYQASDGWHLRDVTGGAAPFAPRINESINWITPLVTASGKQLVLERSERLTLRYAAKPNGWELSAVPLTYDPDLIELSAGVVRIGWSGNQGESTDALTLMDLTLATGATQIGTVSGGGIVWAVGPTLEATTFEVGPVEGSTTGDLLAPIREPIADPKTQLLVTRPWARYFQNLNGAVDGTVEAIASLPAIVIPPSFGVVSPASSDPIVASQSGDTLNLTSKDGSIALKSNTLTKTLDLSLSPIGRSGLMGAPGLDGEDADALLLVQQVTNVQPVQTERAVMGVPGLDGDDAETLMVLREIHSGGGGTGGAYVPVSTGAEPLVIVSNGAGAVLLTPFTP